MGYDLNFWRYSDETKSRTLDDHLAVYRSLCDGKDVEELVALEQDEIPKALISKAPSDWAWEAGVWEREQGGAIEALIKSNWVRFDLYGNWDKAEANWLIDAMRRFGCPLFDPQIPERFVL